LKGAISDMGNSNGERSSGILSKSTILNILPDYGVLLTVILATGYLKVSPEKSSFILETGAVTDIINMTLDFFFGFLP